MSLQNQIKESGGTRVTYKLEFRTWNGSAYVWTDYTIRLVDFSGIGAEAEDAAIPNAFRLRFGSITMDNSDGLLTDIDVLDGLLYNASEPYGKSIYKRMVRISEVRWIDCVETTTIIGTALVRDHKLDSQNQCVILDTMTLDARATDQACDSDKCNRHPLGGTDKSAPAGWNTAAPTGYPTANVNMYRWREEESEDGQVNYGWHRNKRAVDIAEHAAWALDDLATDIDKTFMFYTSDNRRIVTTRQVPPDNENVSTGVTPYRCRAIVWNSNRNVLVCCIGHRIYDYDPVTDIYTLRNSLTAGRSVARVWFITTPDNVGRSNRIVLLQYDVETYLGQQHVTQAWLTVLYDATGAGAYTVTVNEASLGTDVFPGTHQFRRGSVVAGNYMVGQFGSPPQIYGENIPISFMQEMQCMNTSVSIGHELLTDNTIWGAPGVPGYEEKIFPFIASPAYHRAWAYLAAAPLDARFSWGSRFAACICLYQSGGRLHYLTWDVSNGYRVKWLSLYDYSTNGLLNLNGSNLHVPYFLFTHPTLTQNRVYVCQMEWKDTATDYSICHVNYYNWATTAWTEFDWLYGATGVDKAWTVMEVMALNLASPILMAILWNRETGKWRLCTNLQSSWATNDGCCLSGFINGVKDQDNALEGLFENGNYDPRRAFFVERGPNLLWSYDGTLYRENKTPADAAQGDPICTDKGLGALMVTTGGNYPTASTPEGVMFGISENDYGDSGYEHPAGEYVLWQLANFDAGFVKLLDFSGLSFWELWNLLAEKCGYVHYYTPDGTLTFKPRATSGAVDFTFSAANGNYLTAKIVSRGFDSIVNEVTVRPHEVKIEGRTSDIVKTKGDQDSTGLLEDVSVSPSPAETSYWRLVFTDKVTYDLYKLSGVNYSTTMAKVTGQSVAVALRDIPDGAYLSITPDNFSGQFVRNDAFTFWVMESDCSLQQLDDRDLVKSIDATSQAKYQRSKLNIDNRFVMKQTAGDVAAAILNWRKDHHDVVEVMAVFDPAYVPLKRAYLLDSGLGYDGSDVFQIAGVRHNKRDACSLMLVKT